jgi:hypothetical protein
MKIERLYLQLDTFELTFGPIKDIFHQDRCLAEIIFYVLRISGKLVFVDGPSVIDLQDPAKGIQRALDIV